VQLLPKKVSSRHIQELVEELEVSLPVVEEGGLSTDQVPIVLEIR
jgi:hypothetical protein